GVHYDPINTGVGLLAESVRLFAPYLPLAEVHRRYTYVGFSLGGTISALGLGAALSAGAAAPTGRSAAAVTGLILVQPALALARPNLLAARGAGPQAVP